FAGRLSRGPRVKWAEIEIRCAPASVDAVSALLTSVGCGGTAIQDEATREGEIVASSPHPLTHRPVRGYPPPHPLTPSRVLGYLPVDDRLEGSLAELRQRLSELPS